MLGQWAYRRGEPDSGFNGGVQTGEAWNALCPETSRRIDASTGLPATIHDDARTLEPREVLGLLDVSPETTGADCVDRGGSDTVPLRESLSVATGSDVAHSSGVDLCARVPDSALHRAVMLLVCDVFGLRAPSEVVRAVVITDPIQMACDVTAWSGTVECGADERRDSAVDSPPTRAEDDLPVPVPCSPANEGPVCVARPDLPGGADAVLGSLCNGSPLHESPLCMSGTVPYSPSNVNLSGVLAYADPPYLNTTGYAHAFGRDEVVAVARKWANAGARVMISEAVPIPELVADGWHAVEITAMRVGQRRTFSKQQREWVTMNFPPDARAARTCSRALERREAASEAPAVEQVGLFGGGR